MCMWLWMDSDIETSVGWVGCPPPDITHPPPRDHLNQRAGPPPCLYYWTTPWVPHGAEPVGLVSPTRPHAAASSPARALRTGSWWFSAASVCLEGHTPPAREQCVRLCVKDVEAANSSAVTQLTPAETLDSCAHTYTQLTDSSAQLNYSSSCLEALTDTMQHSHT